MHKCTCAVCLGLVIGGCLLAKREDQFHTHVEDPSPVATVPTLAVVSSTSSATVNNFGDGIVRPLHGYPATFRLTSRS